MMGHRQVEQAVLFYEFSLERHIPADHLLRSIDRFVELGGLRRELAPFYSSMGRPSVDPVLTIRMLIVGYCFGIRSERRLCEEVHLNLAYRWFCRLGLDDQVPAPFNLLEEPAWPLPSERSSAPRFRDGFATLHQKGLVGGEAFAVDASLIRADANRQKGIEKVRGAAGRGDRPGRQRISGCAR